MSLLLVSPNVVVSEELLRNAVNSHPEGWGLMYANDGKIEMHSGTKLQELFSALEHTVGTWVLVFKNKAGDNPVSVNPNLWLALDGFIDDTGVTDNSKSNAWNFAADLAKWIEKSAWFDQIDDNLLPYIERWIPITANVALLWADGTVRIANFHQGEEYDGVWLSTPEFTPEYIEEEKKKKESKKSKHYSDSEYAIPNYQDNNDPSNADDGSGLNDDYNVQSEDSEMVILFEPEPCDWCTAPTMYKYKYEGQELCTHCYGEAKGEFINNTGASQTYSWESGVEVDDYVPF